MAFVDTSSAAAASCRTPKYLPYGVAFDVDEAHVGDGFLHQAFPRGLSRRRASPAREREALRAELAEIVDELAAEPRVLCHRDYHSRNLMWRDERLCIIDFQDARLGPDTYDLASLLRDSYVDLPEQVVDELIAYFLALAGPVGRGHGRSAAASI